MHTWWFHIDRESLVSVKTVEYKKTRSSNENKKKNDSTWLARRVNFKEDYKAGEKRKKMYDSKIAR